jgi:pimeloyl-ACP methyl ester carboxylesterase
LPSGADFEILLPEDWGGTLALYSHGLRTAVERDSSGTADMMAEPGGDREQHDRDASGPEPAPRWGAGDNTIADVMLQAGYAVAGAASPQEGWSVRAQVVAAEELHQYFVENIGQPRRVYVWGESTGGLSSVRLAELHPEWVSGAAALCAPMSGPLPSFDLALDAGYAVRELLVPDLPVAGFASIDEAVSVRRRAVAALNRAAEGGERARAKLLFIAALVGLPLQTQSHAGNTTDSQVLAALEGLSNLLDQNTVQRYFLEQAAGGNPSGNTDTDYDARIADEARARVDRVANGSVDRLLARLTKGERLAADIDAARAAAVQGELVGDLKVPALTLHNVADPVHIVQNESWYRDRVDTFGPEIRANLVNAFVAPPAFYSADDPALEGAGHCNFEARTLVGLMIQLDLWARKGQYPGRDSISKAFAGQNVSLDFVNASWPNMGASPQDEPLEPDPDELPAATATAAGAVPSGPSDGGQG